MYNNILFLIIAVILSCLLNLVILKIYKKKKLIIELFIFLLIFLFYIIFTNIKLNNIFEIIFYSIIYFSFFGVYTFTMIMGFEGSPSLKLLELISKRKNSQKKNLLKSFKKESFFKSRFEDLQKKKYLFKKNHKVQLRQKSIILLNIILFIEKIQNSGENNG